jgi:hypothetical protein
MSFEASHPRPKQPGREHQSNKASRYRKGECELAWGRVHVDTDSRHQVAAAVITLPSCTDTLSTIPAGISFLCPLFVSSTSTSSTERTAHGYW